MQPVIIKWVDITTELIWNDSTPKVKPMEFTSIGFLIEDRDEYVVVSDTDGEWGQHTAYPRGCILEMRKLKDGKPDRAATVRTKPKPNRKA
jgi:hypothetical protein